MMTFLMLMLSGLAVVAICGVLLRSAAAPTPPPSGMTVPLHPAQFFASAPAPPPSRRDEQVPLELLLSHIERHVRLEQAAAESFLEVPTSESLQTRTNSPFVN